MKHIKRLMIVSFLVLIVVLLSACGENNSETAADKTAVTEAAVTETTVVLETTPDGGTVEQDSEGNIITKNSEGKVTKVEDKNGNPVSVSEYVKTHSWIENSSNSDSGSGSNSGSDNKNKDPENKNNHSEQPSTVSSDDPEINGTDPVAPEQGPEEGAEEEIPVVIATIPDEEDMEVLPGF